MGSNWVLSYAHDQHGNPVDGDLLTLQNAIINGADVKIVYTTQGGSDWSRHCANVTIKEIEGEPVISATIMELADTTQENFGITFVDSPFAIEHHIYNSSGKRIVVKFDYTSHQRIDWQESNLALNWYTK